MTNEEKKLQIQSAITRIVQQDNFCKVDFINNPRGALKKYLGVEIPENLHIDMINQTDPNTFHFILPYTGGEVSMQPEQKKVNVQENRVHMNHEPRQEHESEDRSRKNGNEKDNGGSIGAEHLDAIAGGLNTVNYYQANRFPMANLKRFGQNNSILNNGDDTSGF